LQNQEKVTDAESKKAIGRRERDDQKDSTRRDLSRNIRGTSGGGGEKNQGQATARERKQTTSHLFHFRSLLRAR